MQSLHKIIFASSLVPTRAAHPQGGPFAFRALSFGLCSVGPETCIIVDTKTDRGSTQAAPRDVASTGRVGDNRRTPQTDRPSRGRRYARQGVLPQPGLRRVVQLSHPRTSAAPLAARSAVSDSPSNPAADTPRAPSESVRETPFPRPTPPTREDCPNKAHQGFRDADPSAIVRLTRADRHLLDVASIRMTTSPPRWIIPKIGGFSLASVPRPGAPFSRRRRPGRPFF